MSLNIKKKVKMLVIYNRTFRDADSKPHFHHCQINGAESFSGIP